MVELEYLVHFLWMGLLGAPCLAALKLHQVLLQLLLVEDVPWLDLSNLLLCQHRRVGLAFLQIRLFGAPTTDLL